MLALSMLVAILIAERPIGPMRPLLPAATEDGIKAAREKFDLEMKLNTKRPWDGMALTGPHALEKRRNGSVEHQ
jgi:hypothetical protein